MVGVGALLYWKFKIDLGTLSKLNLYLLVPAFVFDKVANSTLSWAQMGGVVTISGLYGFARENRLVRMLAAAADALVRSGVAPYLLSKVLVLGLVIFVHELGHFLAARRIGEQGHIVAIDLLEMDAVRGVDFIQGDFTRGSGLKAVQAALAGRRADVVLSDMAPNMSGISVSDQARSMELAEAARDFALLHLQDEGVFLVKVFQGAGYDEYLKSLRAAFRKVVVRKPQASRDESAEQYLLSRCLKAMKPIATIEK
jgi:23S rRNA (uridine2552-2'-O)-methyltransferase